MNGGDVNERLRRLPKVDDVLRGEMGRRLLERAPRWAVVAAVRAEIEALRARLQTAGEGGAAAGVNGDSDGDVDVTEGALDGRVRELVEPKLVRVLNATGVVLHTNLGRAPLAAAALARVVEVSRGYCNLEYQLDGRRRGSRHDHVSELLTSLTGAEAALVVNNCAAAVLLALAELAAGREVIVSRGELVEIGGSFRVPDVMRASGARLVEVGTTNRTHPHDYERALTDQTALLLKVHRSNFAIVGFTAEVSVAELAALGRARAVPTMVDLGSGSLTTSLPGEPSVPEVVAQGADVVTFSGDKLLGGPQAGVLLVRREIHARLRGNPLLRALRPDKMTLAALAGTLELYRDGRAAEEVPVLAQLSASLPSLRARAERLAALIAERSPRLELALIEVRSAVGGGAMPSRELGGEPPSYAVAVSHPELGALALEARLRAASPPLVARIADGRLIADVRTLTDGELPLAAAAFAEDR